MSLKEQVSEVAAAASAVAGANAGKISIGGSLGWVVGTLVHVNWLTVVGITAAIVGIWYQVRRDRRETQERAEQRALNKLRRDRLLSDLPEDDAPGMLHEGHGAGRK